MEHLIFITIALTIGAAMTVVAVMVHVNRRRDFAACGGCGYDVTGSALQGRCPECGAQFTEVGIRPPSRGKRPQTKVVMLAAGVFAALVFGFLVSILSVRAARAQAQAAQAGLMAQQQAAALAAMRAQNLAVQFQAEAAAAAQTDAAPLAEAATPAVSSEETASTTTPDEE